MHNYAACRVPIDRSRSVDPRTAEIRLASVNRSLQTAFPTLFTKHPAHTFAFPVRPSTLSAAPLSVSMVRTYIRKGGHGGDRSKAGLPACYWQEKGGHAAAAAAKAAAKAKALLEEQAAKVARWKQWAKHSDEQQSTSNQLQTVQCPPCEPRLTPHADDDSACARC